MEEIQEATRKFKKELNAGTASLVLLGVLGQATQPMYGYQIAKLVETAATGVDIMKQGALYPVLRSLEANGLLRSEVEPSVAGPPRRYYHITDAGRQTLAVWKNLWRQTEEFVNVVLEGGEDDNEH